MQPLRAAGLGASCLSPRRRPPRTCPYRIIPRPQPWPRVSVTRTCASCSSPPRRSPVTADLQPPTAPPYPPETIAVANSNSIPETARHVDYRTLGAQQELFATSIYSPGSPIFLPRGARIFNRLVEFLRKEYVHYGFDEVITPTIYRKALWARSGHLENYAEDMFSVRGGKNKAATKTAADQQAGVPASGLAASEAADVSGISAVDQAATVALPHESSASASASDASVPAPAPTPLSGSLGEHESEHDHSDAEDTDGWGLKPMNCPAHCLIFASQGRSFRDLPLRFADFGALHRDEISGALTGLTRVRRFHQDDGHVFCRPSQVRGEIADSLDFVRHVYSVLGLGPYRFVLSTRPGDGHLLGKAAEWDRAEAELRAVLEESGVEWSLAEGEGAFYGPKIDVILRARDGRDHQTATVQLDFQLPERFELEYVSPAPEWERRGKELRATDEGGEVPREDLAASGAVRPVLIHRAVLGSVERLMALLIEHHQGKWPFWLNPRQVVVLTVNTSPEVVAWAEQVQDVLLGRRRRSVDGHKLQQQSSPVQPSMLAVDLDASARTTPLKVREAKSKGYGAVVVVGPRNLKNGNVTVDLRSGAGEQEPQGADPWKRLGDMSSYELRSILEGKVALYE